LRELGVLLKKKINKNKRSVLINNILKKSKCYV